jgi:DNA-directed RNA polymerase II subunit RPB2
MIERTRTRGTEEIENPETVKIKGDVLAWKVLDKYFTDNPNNLVTHHLESFNNFFQNGLTRVFKENNPIKFRENKLDEAENPPPQEENDYAATPADSETDGGAGTRKKTTKVATKVTEETKQEKSVSSIDLYIGGKDGNSLYFGKPVIYDSKTNHTHYMYPNDARLRNMTYGMTIHYDVYVEMKYNVLEEKEPRKENFTIEKILLGTFPIMLQSDFCILNGMSRDVRFYMGECRNDYGGYFIIDGKEKVIVCQEKFANNQLSVTTNKVGSSIGKKFICSASVKSVSDDVSKPKRTTRVMIVTPSSKFQNTQIVVDVPNVSVPVPLFILMRALGVISDKEIIEVCLLDIEREESYVDLFIPCVHDAAQVFSQNLALKYIASFTKQKTVPAVLKILADMFLPHIGDVNFLNKAYYLGYMVFRLLKVYTKQEPDTNIDEYNFKRIETSGALLDDLFNEYYLLQHKLIKLKVDKKYNYKPRDYAGASFPKLIKDNVIEIFEERVVENGFKAAFKGNWGAESHTKRDGIVQDLSRLSWNSFMTHLRKITLQIDKTSKVVGPRKLNNSQWGIIDPFDTPDGAGVGLDKHFSILARVSSGTCVVRDETEAKPKKIELSSTRVIKFLKEETNMRSLLSCDNPQYIYTTIKVFVNGNWLGVIDDAFDLINKFKQKRRLGVLPVDISISFNYKNEININTDAGRLIRPVYYFIDFVEESGKKNRVLSALNEESYERLKHGTITWKEIVSGSLPEGSAIDENSKRYQCLLEYIDTEEEQSALIAPNFNEIHKPENKGKLNYYTHMEIDGSLLLSVMGNLVSYPEHNPIPRNSFSCGQSKQAVSVFNTNYQLRMDKMAVVLNYGQVPLIKTRYLNYFNKEEMPYGVNTIVAIMSYTGYNVEDAILINEGAIQRGLFRTTYLTTYEGREESSKVRKKDEEVSVDSLFKNVENNINNVSRINNDYDYSELDVDGFIGENVPVNDKTVLIGKLTTDPEDETKLVDTSVHTKKGQTGYTDKVYVSVGEDGFKIAKVRIREDRIPSIGDKMASRCGQKGTIGIILAEKDMPFTSDGVRPDLIINPHALPSRMTIGQLIESMFGKVCTSYGLFGEGTAFKVDGSNYSTYGEMLVAGGYHSSGNQLLYDGVTGEQLEANIFIGPTYYMRLKHMVKDKINHRDEGPNTSLTRQPVQGRSNDGGLRIGEMERDGVLAHGMSKFLNESFMERAGDDRFELAICNKTGAIAIFNRQRNLFFSPLSDGPIKFNAETKKPDEDLKIESVSRFGRSFSVVLVPYTFKLLMQELEAMNIQMRIITDDNVDQLLSLCYSDNISKLLKIKDKQKSLNDIITHYTSEMRTTHKKKPPQEKEKVDKKSWMDKFKDEEENLVFKKLDEADKFIRESFEHIDISEPPTSLPGGFLPDVRGNWALTKQAALSTLRYIFDEVKCNTYLLCVIKDKKAEKKISKLVKLEPTGIPKFFEELIYDYGKNEEGRLVLLEKLSTIVDSKRELLGYDKMRVMNCILKKRSSKEEFSKEYKKFIGSLPDLPQGIFVLNLTDATIIRRDNLLPWGEPRSSSDSGYFLPVFSLSGAQGFLDIPMPNYDDIFLLWPEKPKKDEKKDTIDDLNRYCATNPWEGRKPIAVFRGGPTGCGLDASSNDRINLAEMARNSAGYLDAGLVSKDGPMRYDAKKNRIGKIDAKVETVPKKSYEEQAGFKYIIHIDGNVAAYRLISTMLLGSVILKVQGDYTLWYEGLLNIWNTRDNIEDIKTKNFNCIHVDVGLVNLTEVIDWCRQNDDICREIAQNGVILAKMILNRNYIETSFTNMLNAVQQESVRNEEQQLEFDNGWANQPQTLDIQIIPADAPPSKPPTQLKPHSPTAPPPPLKPPDDSGDWVRQVSRNQDPGKLYWLNSRTLEKRWVNAAKKEEMVLTPQEHEAKSPDTLPPLPADTLPADTGVPVILQVDDDSGKEEKTDQEQQGGGGSQIKTIQI